MNQEPKDVKSIFAEALEKKTPQDRAAYLDKACGGDADLRSKLESLLESHDQAGSFLEAPALDVTVTFDKSPLTEGPGTVIGPYKLLEKIGEGGMAYVYMAEQERPLRRRVALKIIKLGMDTKQVIARFEVERQALAVMDHPNIAKVFDAGATETGRPYFVMELVKGVSITEYCDKNKLSTPERLDLFIQVCNAVQHAHQKGIIHRDIKPSNVMVTLHDGKPVPKVIDFGIAKATIQRLTEKTLFTKYAQMIGTPEYMSPEQAEMSGLDIDTRADIYSLGVLLYELLTGTTPFDAEDLRSKGYGEMQRIIRETEPLKPSTKLSTMGDALTGVAEHRKTNPDLLAKLVRGDLDWIVMKTLEKDRTRRYETVSSLAADVKRHLNEEPVEAGPPGATYRIGKFIRKHRRTVAAVVAIAATLIIALIISTTLYFAADHARNREAVARATAEDAKKTEQEQRKLAEEQRSLAETKAEDLRRSLYVNRIQLTDSKYQEGDINRVRELLDSCPNDLRGWEWDRLNYISDQSLMSFVAHSGRVNSLALSPDGKRIVSSGWGQTVKVWDIGTGKELITIPRAHGGNEINCVAFSPDGRQIVSGDDSGEINIWDAASGNKMMALTKVGEWVSSAAFSPDSKWIAAPDDKTIRIWDANSGAEIMSLSGHQDEVRSVAFSPDGKRIVSSSEGAIKIWDAFNGKEIVTLGTWSRNLQGSGPCLYSPDGKFIVSGGNKEIKLWDAATGGELMTLRGHTGPIESVVFSPDAKQVVSGSMDNTIKVWDTSTGENVLTLRGHKGFVTSVVFTSDGRQIISGSWDDTIKIWDVAIDREIAELPGDRALVGSIAFSPDGNRIASGSAGGMVKLWDVESGTELMTLRGGRKELRFVLCSVAFSPDGKCVAAGGVGRTFKTWDAASGAELMTFRGPAGALAFSPDGKLIASGSRELKIWDASSGKELRSLDRESGGICVAFSPDGKLIAAGGYDPTIKVWDWQNGREYLTLRGHGAIITSVGFSPDGKRIVSSCQNDYMVKVWDAVIGAELMTLKHSDVVISAAFSPDGKRVVSGCRDRTARVWDATTGAQLLTLRAGSGVTTVAFSPDGKTIAAGSFDTGVLLWDSSVPRRGYESRRNGEAARRIVDELYDNLEYYYEIIDKLQADETLGEPVRKLALQIANSRKWEDPEKLDNESGEVVRLPDRDSDAYESALGKAQKANSLEPNNPNRLTTLGAAQYRVGAYQDGLMTLSRADKIRTDANEPSAPEDLAFVAMSLHKLGRVAEGQAALTQLHSSLEDRRLQLDKEAKDVLFEAEKLFAGGNTRLCSVWELIKGGKIALCPMKIEWPDNSASRLETRYGRSNLQPSQVSATAIDRSGLAHEAFVLANRNCSYTS